MPLRPLFAVCVSKAFDFLTAAVSARSNPFVEHITPQSMADQLSEMVMSLHRPATSELTYDDLNFSKTFGFVRLS